MKRCRRILGAAVLVAASIASDRPRATGNLEVATQSGAKIGTRVWNNASLPIVWRFHDPSTFAGCYSNTNAPVSALQPASAAGFDAWQNDPDSRIAFTYGGLTTARSAGTDGVNLVTWCDAGVLGSDLGFLAQTPSTALTSPFTVTAGGGCPPGQGIMDLNGASPPGPFCFPAGTFPAGTIVDADVRFNSYQTFEQDNFSTNGTPGSADVQATATHENGHVFGLSHDPVWQSVMFPYIDDEPASDGAGGQRVLKRSDLSTSGHYYPAASYGSSYGSITGFITLDGSDADGVHVVAIDSNTMLAVAGRFTLSHMEDAAALGTEGSDYAANGAGFYRIDGLPPGSYYVYVEYFDATDWFTGRLHNLYNLTVDASIVSNGNPNIFGQDRDWLGFIPQLTEFYNAGDTGNGGNSTTPGSATDNSDAATLVSVAAGAVTSNINIAINIDPSPIQPPLDRQNPTQRATIYDDAIQTGDPIAAYQFDGGTDDYYAVKFPFGVLPTPPYNVAEGKWIRAGKNTLPMRTRLAFEDPNRVNYPALDNPMVASAGRVLSGGPNGATAAGDFVEVRDQWNVTVNDVRDVWIIINQPQTPAGATLITEGYFAVATQDGSGVPRVGNTLTTQDGGATYGLLPADVFYDLIIERDPPVMINSATPAAMQEGVTANVTINGAGFQAGATADFGVNTTTGACTRLTAQQLRCPVTVADTGAMVSRQVVVKVTNPSVIFPNVARIFTVQPGDADGDGTVNLQDCAPLDGTLEHPATQVMNITIGGGDTSSAISWDSQDAINGTATSYDIVTGLAISLRPNGGYAGATCAVNDRPDTPFTDPNPVPVGTIRYWIMRAHNACNSGPGTYGDSTQTPDPRDALDAGAPCAN
jgi:matrixin